MKIATLAARVGISVNAIRFYERAEVIPAAQNTKAGFRMYEESAFRALVVARWAQELGLAVDDVALLFQAPEGSRNGRLRRALDGARAAVAEERERLARLEAELNSLAALPVESPLPAEFVDALISRHETRAREFPEQHMPEELARELAPKRPVATRDRRRPRNPRG
jgi:DNA-binding transcriptional MerR regulator